MQLEDASHTTGRATHVRYVVLIFLCVLAFLTYFDRVCIASAQADIERDLRLTDAQMGLILGGFWLAYGLFEIPGGWMGDRFGSRYTLSRIVLAWSIFTALSGSAIGFLSLFACRFFFGVGEAGAFPNMARVQSRWFPLVAQGRVGGMLWLVARWRAALSFALFPLLMSAAGSPSFRRVLGRLPGSLAAVPSWRIAFWICGLLGLVWVLLFFLWFRDDPAEKSSVNQAELALIRAGRAEADPRAQAAMSRRLWAELFSSGRLWEIAGRRPHVRVVRVVVLRELDATIYDQRPSSFGNDGQVAEHHAASGGRGGVHAGRGGSPGSARAGQRIDSTGPGGVFPYSATRPRRSRWPAFPSPIRRARRSR